MTNTDHKGRLTVSLDGMWAVGESVGPREIPSAFSHQGPVPGLVNLAQPPFPQVDEFEGCEWNENRIRRKELTEADRVTGHGRSEQPRNYFWYRTTFVAPSDRTVAFLVINKAQFGLAAWLNGQSVGEEPACFSSARFDLRGAIRWGRENEVILRIGAHPGVLPPDFPAGSDFEKMRWTPGIYDSVSVCCCDNPVIDTVQVVPRVSPRSLLAQIKLVNASPVAGEAVLSTRVTAWPGGAEVAASIPERITLAAGEERTITRTIELPDARLWSPEDPCLYVLETSTGGDSLATRFGLREFRSDTRTGQFYLNGNPCPLRGSNITLHRFFEDAKCGALPWTDAWVRRLLQEIPRQLHWNSFRFSIGPVPQRWFDIADEAGLLIQNEFFIWTGHPKWHERAYARHWNEPELIRQYSNWMRDHWNHPSVVIWDACNETFDAVFGRTVIPAVRGLDLSGRPWDNGYNDPAGPDDPVEIHPYFHAASHFAKELQFNPAQLETMTREDVIKLGSGEDNWHGHPLIINEYPWLWLNRDGTPTRMSRWLYDTLVGADADARRRFAFYAYEVAAETEFFRCSRWFAGVMHFAYLGYSRPQGDTSDPFRDIERLELEPHFADYAAEAFKPLGLCLRFFRSTAVAGAELTVRLAAINDHAHAVSGRATLTFEIEGGDVLARAERPFNLAAHGDTVIDLPVTVPGRLGRAVLKAVAAGDGGGAPTVCRRHLEVVSPAGTGGGEAAS